MFQRFGGRPGNLAHLDRIEALVRARFELAPDRIVLVSEEASRVPGFPPLETVVRFWTAPDRRYRLRLFKPAAEVAEGDIPVAWLLPSLLDDGDPDCC